VNTLSLPPAHHKQVQRCAPVQPAHNVKFHRTGIKRFHHPLVGDLTLTFEAFELAADPGQRLNIYTAEPGSPSHDALNLLASWISTPTDADVKGDR